MTAPSLAEPVTATKDAWWREGPDDRPRAIIRHRLFPR
jgi:hypothetical protein